MQEIQFPKILVVTPARDEARNIKLLAASLEAQTQNVILRWIVVDDGSIDETATICHNFEMRFKFDLVKRERSGKLITGGAFSAWWTGVNFGIAKYPDSDFVMKLDADIELSDDYFERLFEKIDLEELGIAGGCITGSHREQNVYVPGPVKMYSRRALEHLRELPVATGFDVMDAILCWSQGLKVQVVPTALFKMNRKIGHSEGLLHGCYRNGRVCRWVGYAPEYFMMHMLRHFFRPPLFFGPFWMLYGFISASEGPYSLELRKRHRSLQRQRLRQLLKNPISSVRKLYYPK